jgi:hypothetical protein
VARANAIAPRPNGVVATRRTRHVRECAAACTEGARAEAPEGRDATEGRRARTDARERAGRRAVPREGATIAARAPADGLIERARGADRRARASEGIAAGVAVAARAAPPMTKSTRRRLAPPTTARGYSRAASTGARRIA